MIPSNNAEIVVTPCVGVWIETERYHITESRSISVTPCVGVWIETRASISLYRSEPSLPAWVCGLKHTADEAV